MSYSDGKPTGEFLLRSAALNSFLALVLGFSYRFLFLLPTIRDRGGAPNLAGSLVASLVFLVILAVASSACLIAFRIGARIRGKILASFITGAFVTMGVWLSLAQQFGFPIVAGLAVGVSFFLLQVLPPYRSSPENRALS